MARGAAAERCAGAQHTMSVVALSDAASSVPARGSADEMLCSDV